MAQPAVGARFSRRIIGLLSLVALLGALLPLSTLPVAAQDPPPPPSAGGFLFYKLPTPQPVCNGLALHITPNPYYSRADCGFSEFTLSNAPAGAIVRVALSDPDGTVFDTLTATGTGTTRRFNIRPDFTEANGDQNPDPAWPAGVITATVGVGGSATNLSDIGTPAGRVVFGHNLLGASLEVAGQPYAPGADVPVTGNIHKLDTDVDGAVEDQGVAASFSLVLIAPDGTENPVESVNPITADSDGDFSVTIPGAETAGFVADERTDFELKIAVAAINASYTDGEGPWAAKHAGTTPVTLRTPPDRLLLDASYGSALGWVKPGGEFPFRVFLTNFTDAAATNVVVTITAPPSADFSDAVALAGAGTVVVAPDSITWSFATVAAATDDGPTVHTLVVTGEADTLDEDPEIVWKDLSTTATVTYDENPRPEVPISSTTHGPKVIPPAGNFETARYGDKPFPMVPVEYVDLERQPGNDSAQLDFIVNDPEFTGSTYNLYQEMSYGQLFPEGTVPSTGIATAGFPDVNGDEAGLGWDFTEPDRSEGTCRGETFGEDALPTEGTVEGVGDETVETPDTEFVEDPAVGSALYSTRIADGWYQLPGTTEYYGGDWPAFTSGPGSNRDGACGPRGKAVYDAAHIADPEIDYNEFDFDKDGVVDFFMLVFVGCGGNGPSQLGPLICPYSDPPGQPPAYDNIWPHSWSLEDQFEDEATGLRGYISRDQLKSLEEVPQCWLDDSYVEFTDCTANGGTGDDALPVYVRVGPYNVNPETVFEHNSVISHEYGHYLGLPDFYSTTYDYYADTNLMAGDYGQHMTIFSKQEMGWVVPDFLQPGDAVAVEDWSEVKNDTGVINWQTQDGIPYTLSEANGDQNIHNGQAYGVKLPGRIILDPQTLIDAEIEGTHVWWSRRGNDFGCPPLSGSNLDIHLPELADAPADATVTVEFMSAWDIEWDFDYGFVLTTTDGETYTSQPSENGYTTPSVVNPNANDCQERYGNGITGTSGAYEAGPAAVAAARNPVENDYSHGAPFIPDSYDISDLVGAEVPVLRFSYSTDPGLDRPGWFIDDIRVLLNDEVIYESDFETDPEEGRLIPGGCEGIAFRVAEHCTAGWNRITVDALATADHAYYLELRDQTSFDYNGWGEADRGDTAWQPGVFLEYTDETHGYGNVGVPPPPAQHYIDAAPVPGENCFIYDPLDPTGILIAPDPNCHDLAFLATAERDHFDDFADPDADAQAANADAEAAAVDEGYINSFSDPNSKYGDDFWHFDYGCLTLDVTDMVGEDVGPEPPPANLVADADISAGAGCAEFIYGKVELPDNLPPVAAVEAKPTTAEIGQLITFDGSGSTDDRQAPNQLSYSWDFGDGTPVQEGQSVQHAYATAGTFTVTLTVTDADAASDVATVDVTVNPAAATPTPTPTDGGEATPTPTPIPTSTDGGEATPTPTPDGGGQPSPTPSPSARFIPNTAFDWVTGTPEGIATGTLLLVVLGAAAALGAVQYRMRRSRR